MKLGKIEFDVFRECLARFDGGATFGHVPKAVWSRLVDSDELNRIQISCNTALIRMDDRTILTDVGMGTKWNEKEVGLYGLEMNSFDDLLKPYGITPADITDIVLSHLHIDHAGGLTRFAPDGGVELVFPNAKVYVQKGEWEAANNPDPRSRPSYRPHDFRPVYEAGKLELLEGNGRLFDGCEVEVTGGHTLNHQIARFSSGGEELYVLSDIIASAVHLKPHWVMGYDLYPVQVMQARLGLLPRIAHESVRAVFAHDPWNLVVRVFAEKEGKYDFEPMVKGT